jgi:HTH-type transcriptional regulator/antitoxin MqsA
MKKNVCPICGDDVLKKEVVEEKFDYKGRSIIIPDYIVYRCNKCNEAIVDRETLKNSGRLLKDFRRSVDGLLSAEQIRRIRKKIGLTQEQMAEILGGGLKSFARYESGLVCQSRAMDNLLRILDRYPYVICAIRRETSEGSKEQKESFVITKNVDAVANE